MLRASRRHHFLYEVPCIFWHYINVDEVSRITLKKIIVKCDGIITNCESLVYYKVRWTVTTNSDIFFITKCDTVYYKLLQVLQSAMDLLQIATGITKRDDYYKLRQYKTIRTLPFLPTPLTTPSLTLCLRSSENQIVGAGSRSGRINRSQCTFPRFVIGLVFLLLLPTLTIWFSLDHTRNVSDGVISGIGTLFSLDHKLYDSDYDSDSDSVSSENQHEGILYAHASIWAVEVPQRHFLRIVYVQYQHLTCIGCYIPRT